MAAKGQPKTGGRAKGSPNRATADIKALAQTYGPDAVDTLAEIMKDVSAPSAARVSAARELIDRGFGKAIQTIHNAGTDGGPMQFAEVTREKFRDIAKELAAKV